MAHMRIFGDRGVSPGEPRTFAPKGLTYLSRYPPRAAPSVSTQQERSLVPALVDRRVGTQTGSQIISLFSGSADASMRNEKRIRNHFTKVPPSNGRPRPPYPHTRSLVPSRFGRLAAKRTYNEYQDDNNYDDSLNVLDSDTDEEEEEDDDESEDCDDPNDKDYEPPSRKPKRKLEHKECIVCYDDVTIDRFPKEAHPGASAVHERDICYDCWQLHLDAEVQTKSWDAIKCAQCPHILTEPEMKKLASAETYAAWQEKALQSYLQGEQDIYPCPAANCTARGVVPPGNHILDCSSCGYRYCIDCRAPMHERESCSGYQKRLRENGRRHKRKQRQAVEERASEKLVKKTSKPCPKCSIRLDKYAGCDHITCKRCNHEFCWLCFASYKGPSGIHTTGNSAHQSTCPHHPGRLPSLADPHAYDTDSDDGEDENENDDEN